MNYGTPEAFSRIGLDQGRQAGISEPLMLLNALGWEGSKGFGVERPR